MAFPVYEVRPGVIATDMTAGVKEAYDARIADGLVPEGRWGTPEDVGVRRGGTAAWRRPVHNGYGHPRRRRAHDSARPLTFDRVGR